MSANASRRATPVFTADEIHCSRGRWSHHIPDDFTSLINGIQSRVFDYLPDDTWFYPGHGDDSTWASRSR
jgi:glyoxylase-like metal-dependent hydrolase (beta-lactamase superfamily II)